MEFIKFEKLYNFNLSEKKRIFDDRIMKLINFHKKKSKIFSKIMFYSNTKSFKKLDDIPPIPVTAFKKHELLSVKKHKIIKTLHSSGTSGNSTSKIFLDSNNSKNQTWVLSKIMESIFGSKRLPMLVIEKEPNFTRINRFFQIKDFLYLMRITKLMKVIY